MEGVLVVPPDRGTIIGRALWKPRYVSVGPPQREQQPQAQQSQQTNPASRVQAARVPAPRPLPNALPETVYLTIYKAKGDWEPVQQHAISSITDCQVQMIAHRKQGPVLPTLVINVSPDPATDKLRKRRSSRTAGLTTTKETAPTTLWFRPGDERHTLQDWARCIRSFIQTPATAGPISPVTPASPTFINPFSPMTREPSDYYQRPGSGNPNSRSTLSHKTSTQTQSSRERPVTYSESPSLRSRRSDLSHASSLNPSQKTYGSQGHGYAVAHPADLPSPATTIGEYQGEFIEGWTSAQGRSSTLSSPVRGRDSISSQPSATPIPGTVGAASVAASIPAQPLLNSSSPPIPRETILDRAFQLRYIPGSDREVPGEEKLSSLARFDALMREADERRRLATALEAKPPNPPNDGLKSAWDLDDDSSDEEEDSDDEGEDGDDEAREGDLSGSVYIPPPAQRALDFIASRHQAAGGGSLSAARSPQQTPTPRGPVNFDPETLKTLNSGYSHLRPQTGYSRNRPAIAQRTHSQPHLAVNPPPASFLDPHPPLPAAARTPDDSLASSPLSQQQYPGTEQQRQSASTAKRLSFTEFTKRLSSTSSLLLVQTNASSASSRGSSDMDAQQQQQHQHHLNPAAAGTGSGAARGNPNPRGVPPPPPPERCGFRGSVGVFGSEGGFL